MVKQDPHRPGPTYGRLVDHEIPVWALILHMIAIGDTDDLLAQANDRLIAETAADYRIPEPAVRAALADYARNRAAIDAKLASIAAAASA